MNEDELGAEHNWSFQEEKMLHENKSQDWLIVSGALLTLGISELTLAGCILHWVGVI